MRNERPRTPRRPSVRSGLTGAVMLLLLNLMLSTASLTGQEVRTDSAPAGQSYGADDLAAMARENSLEVIKARADLGVSRGELQSARAQRLPILGAEVSASYLSNPLDAMAIPAGAFGGGLPLADIELLEAMENSYYRLSLSLDQPLFTWGKIASALDIAEATLETNREALDDARISAETEARILYTSILGLTEISEILAEQARLAGRIESNTEEARESGFILEYEVLAARAAGQKILLARMEIEQRIAESVTRLGDIVGIDSLSATDLAFPGDGLPDIPVADPGYDGALEANANLRRLKAGLEAARAGAAVGRADAYHLPDIGLRLEAAYEDDQLPFSHDEWFEEGFQFTATVAIGGTVLDFGRSMGEYRAAEERVAGLEASYEQARAEILAEIARLFRQLEYRLAEIDYASTRADYLESRMAVSDTLVSGGSVGEEQLLADRIEYLTVKIEEITANMDFHRSYWMLYYLSGGAYR
jgi:outer membrane protein